jgi:hypothetical protein
MIPLNGAPGVTAGIETGVVVVAVAGVFWELERKMPRARDLGNKQRNGDDRQRVWPAGAMN